MTSSVSEEPTPHTNPIELWLFQPIWIGLLRGTDRLRFRSVQLTDTVLEVLYSRCRIAPNTTQQQSHDHIIVSCSCVCTQLYITAEQLSYLSVFTHGASGLAVPLTAHGVQPFQTVLGNQQWNLCAANNARPHTMSGQRKRASFKSTQLHE